MMDKSICEIVENNECMNFDSPDFENYRGATQKSRTSSININKQKVSNFILSTMK